ncbi:MAG: glycosyltransferase [Robiginitomaculum sp.]|nr:glycosyltransferase [Robiginitomaculum sp.]
MVNREKTPGLQTALNLQSGASSDDADHLRGVDGAKIIRVRDSEAYRAGFDLAQKLPHFSAAGGVTVGQWVVLLVLVALFVSALVIAPGAVLHSLQILLVTIFWFAICFRAALLFTHYWPKNTNSSTPDVSYASEDLPIYTLLLPVYDEAKILPELVKSIKRMDYPTNLLDIKLLLEAGDETTLAAARKLNLPSNWQVLIVPDIGPRTKPKALNVGLARAKGSFVTIYDAEDRPDPAQLRAAVSAFANDDGNMACVQAPLGYYNADHNWITKQFSLEYNAQFKVILPALVRLGIAFPLGGTSNHFRKSALEQTRGWDPFNVTEDADLGFRLAKMGWRAGVISPPTMEEATARVRPWIGQRSRWIKGFIQTLIVHLRGGLPGGKPIHTFGFFSVLGLAVFSAFSHGFLLLAFCLCLLNWALGGPATLSGTDYLLASSGVAMAWVLLLAGCHTVGKWQSFWSIISSVFYWPLQTWAALRAAIELFYKPFYWEKTDHGHSLDEAADK